MAIADGNSNSTRTSTGGAALSAKLLGLVDVGIASVLLIAPLFMGGRGPVGQLVFVTLVCLTATAWFARQCVVDRPRWRWSGAEWLLLGGLMLPIIQLCPLPTSALSRLSPTVPNILTLWNGESGWENWSRISLAPVATRDSLVCYIAFALLFLVLVQRLHSTSDVGRLLRLIAVAGVGMAVIGLLQMLVSNGKFLWIYEHPFRTTRGVVMGTFQNRNHCAHFLALTIGPLIWWLRFRGVGEGGAERRATSGFGRPRTDESLWRHAVMIGLGVVGFAALLTMSRGGFVVLCLAAASCLAIFVWKALLRRRTLLSVCGILLVMGVALALHGYEPLSRRLSAVGNAQSLSDLSEGRQALWSALCRAIPEFAMLGSGAGSHQYVYPMFMNEHFDVVFTHGESGYLPLLLESGVVGLGLMLIGVALCAYWLVRVLLLSLADEETTSGRLGAVACAAAVAPGILASVVHSVGDFVWYIPACMAMTIALAACANRLFSLSAKRGGAWEFEVPRSVCVGTAVLVVGASALLIHEGVAPALAAPHWDKYLSVSMNTEKELRGVDREAAQVLGRMQEHLTQSLAKNPDDPRANLGLASVCLRRFEIEQRNAENAFGISQVRDAALASQFPSREAQNAWLDAAVGENRRLLDMALEHARRAVRLCPLQGEGYVHLAEVSFLEGSDAQAKHRYLDQARLVRPHSGLVSFALGKEAATMGDVQATVTHWRKAFNTDPEVQLQLIDMFASQFPAVFFLDNLEPNRQGLSRLFDRYRGLGLLDEARAVGHRYARVLQQDAEQAKSEKQAGDAWHLAHEVHVFLGDLPAAVQCQRRAVAAQPNDTRRRRSLADVLIKSERYEDAIEHLQHCLRRTPADNQLKEQLISARQQHLRTRR